MNYITLLSLLQKNFRWIQNRNVLKEMLQSQRFSSENLKSYLEENENLFFKQFLQDEKTVVEEYEHLQKLQRFGVNFSYPGEAHYPFCFEQMPGAPFFFTYQGCPAWNACKSLAVVGSRDASPLSRTWMEDSFATFLRQENPVVVSGGARGIDQMAHQLALRNYCATIVVLPSGLGSLYPASLDSWRTKIIDGGGCLLSEYSYDQPMLKHFFHDRNRLIAALGSMTLLVEAKRRSGSLLTAQKTLELGKAVLVVPGHPSDLSHLGNIDLLSEGATPVRDAEDLCMYFRSELNTQTKSRTIASQISFFEN